jgi:hypothetical protein
MYLPPSSYNVSRLRSRCHRDFRDFFVSVDCPGTACRSPGLSHALVRSAIHSRASEFNKTQSHILWRLGLLGKEPGQEFLRWGFRGRGRVFSSCSLCKAENARRVHEVARGYLSQGFLGRGYLGRDYLGGVFERSPGY